MTGTVIWAGMYSRDKSWDCLLISILSLQLSLPHSSQAWSSRIAATRSRSPSSTACSSVSRCSASCRYAAARLVFVSFCCCLLLLLLLPLHGMQGFSDLFSPTDLDDTLYPLSSGIADHVKKNIEGEVPLLLLLLTAACFCFLNFQRTECLLAPSRFCHSLQITWSRSWVLTRARSRTWEICCTRTTAPRWLASGYVYRVFPDPLNCSVFFLLVNR
ncbi:Catalytic/ hydrolase [Zea mays]|uniref:Catalytic/ hydrolase n=1 Tax=Zea mays TaxID=4577 RepID=A0A1D6PDQ7_MAIZE|nr:Catalytic/ hydrolase [Zea mays]